MNDWEPTDDSAPIRTTKHPRNTLLGASLFLESIGLDREQIAALSEFTAKEFQDLASSEYKRGVDSQKEIVICAAIKCDDGRILRCNRHGDGMLNAHHNGWKLAEGSEQQGFITSKGRYVSREEGRILQDEAGIPSADPEGYRGKTLFSEDLY